MEKNKQVQDALKDKNVNVGAMTFERFLTIALLHAIDSKAQKSASKNTEAAETH